ncbi:MAG: hypothetical protein LBH22_07780 [Bacteroidales bacterium]|jgi:hypothetical protein|nr:hypothetical protein [Bacteroidales bacterium]
MRFSQRIGKKPVKTILQVDSIDRDLKNCLWNVILEQFFYKFDHNRLYGEITPRVKLFVRIWQDFFKETIDTEPHRGFEKFFNEWFLERATWYEIYDFVEFAVQILPQNGSKREELKDSLNWALEKEKSGYRIIGENVAKIIDENEIKAIEEALVSTGKWEPITIHLKTALDLFTDRKNPDYRNSIKESISAVEACCIIIQNNDKATLGGALSVIEKRINCLMR